MIDDEVVEISDDDEDEEDGVEDDDGENMNLVDLGIGQPGMGGR